MHKASWQFLECLFHFITAVAFAFLRVPNTELLKQELSRFTIDQFLVGDETVVMSVRELDDFCMRKSVLIFGNDGPEIRGSYISIELSKCGFLFLGVGV